MPAPMPRRPLRLAGLVGGQLGSGRRSSVPGLADGDQRAGDEHAGAAEPGLVLGDA